MRAENEILRDFVRAVRSRLNRIQLLQTSLVCLLLVAAVVVLAALAYVLRGYAVPQGLYLAGGGLFLLLTVIGYFFRLRSGDDAARFADRFFSLKDSVVSALHFGKSEKKSEFVELQSKATAELVEKLEPTSIPYSVPRKVAVTAVGLVVVAACLSFKQPSQEVLDRLRAEAETLARSEEINDHLEDLVDELEKSLVQEAKDELNLDRIRKEVAALKETEDQKEAMRQYAELERQLRSAARRLEQRKNAQILARAGEEVQKDAENRELGQKLASKQFRPAADDLATMQEAVNAPNRKLSEQRKDLARLKAASMRMAAAAKAASRQGSQSSGSAESRQGNQSQKNNSGSKGQGGSGSQGSNGSSGESGENMEEMLSQLNESVANLDKSLQRAEQEQKMNGKPSDKTSGECKSCRSSMNKSLDQLRKSLCKMGAKKQSRQQLLSMCKSLGQCQGFLCRKDSMSLSQCMKQGQGKGIGMGSVESRREGTDEPFFAGETSQLQGQKGSGPSTSTTESADSGDGVSSRRVTNQRREFQKQVESFVQREDVPDDVKDGVKNYFTRIHKSSEE